MPMQKLLPKKTKTVMITYNAEVEIINPVADTVAAAAFQGADVDWYIKAEDIILKNRDGHSTGNLQNHNPHDKKEIKNHK